MHFRLTQKSITSDGLELLHRNFEFSRNFKRFCRFWSQHCNCG